MHRLTRAAEPGPHRAMSRLGELDLPDRLAPAIPRVVTQLAVALLCAVAAEVLRMVINTVAPGAAMFALVFPAIMVATLFARWLSGALTATMSIGYVYFVFFLPSVSPRAVNPALSLFAIAVGAGLTVALAETFRRSVNRATRERDREIADRDLFLEEFDHRVKNNFTIVAGLLDMQRRRAGDPATAEALGIAVSRVESIARAHRHLYRNGQPGLVEMRDYLGDLCAALAEALSLRGGITLDCHVADAAVQRDRAVSIGLIVNELVTNAAKHAFGGRESGIITVTFAARSGGWALSVGDNGTGIAAAKGPSADGGLGSRLIAAFARQAGGTIVTDSDPTGTTVTLMLDA
ncbi:MAG: sensor histidine kinase [Sphingomonas sp.]